MLMTYTHKNITWIDIESPTKEEIHKIMNEYSITRLY